MFYLILGGGSEQCSFVEVFRHLQLHLFTKALSFSLGVLYKMNLNNLMCIFPWTQVDYDPG